MFRFLADLLAAMLGGPEKGFLRLVIVLLFAVILAMFYLVLKLLT